MFLVKKEADRIPFISKDYRQNFFKRDLGKYFPHPSLDRLVTGFQELETRTHKTPQDDSLKFVFVYDDVGGNVEFSSGIKDQEIYLNEGVFMYILPSDGLRTEKAIGFGIKLTNEALQILDDGFSMAFGFHVLTEHSICKNPESKLDSLDMRIRMDDYFREFTEGLPDEHIPWFDPKITDKVFKQDLRILRDTFDNMWRRIGIGDPVVLQKKFNISADNQLEPYQQGVTPDSL